MSKRAEERLIFVSHSGPDTWIAKPIAREIEARGATPFLDEALEQPYVWAEIGAAWGRRIPIAALLLGPTATELQSRPGISVRRSKNVVSASGSTSSMFSPENACVTRWNLACATVMFA